MNRYDESNKVTIISILLNIGLTVIKVIAGILGNSTAIIADGLHSASDIITSIGILIGNRTVSYTHLGENSSITRREILKGLEFFGFTINTEKNELRGKIQEISNEDSRVKVYVVPTNEELMIAKMCIRDRDRWETGKLGRQP